MINDIHIQNFKLFKSFKVEKLPQILLVGGKNNSGKTNFLEAVYFPLDCLNPYMFLNPLRRRGIDFIDKDFLFESAYHNFDRSRPMIFEYTLNFEKKKLQYEFLQPSVQPLNISKSNNEFLQPSVQPLNISKSNNEFLQPSVQPLNTAKNNIVDLQQVPDRNRSRIKISYWRDEEKSKKPVFLTYYSNGTLSFENSNLLDHYNSAAAAFKSAFISRFEAEDSYLFGQLDKLNQTAGVVSALQILEPQLKSLSVIPLANKPALYGDIGSDKKIPLKLMGEGMNRLVSVLLAFSVTKNGVVLVDELENGFHFSVLKKIWKALAVYARDNNTQIIATTHSRELIDAAVEGLPEDMRDNFKYMRIDREGDAVKPVFYDFENLETALDSNFETR